jgi:deazaflavin-dependent oxidoreductase (nitroreductase family)
MRASMRFGRSRAGQLFGKHVVARTDVWLGRLSSGRLNWGMFNVPSATLHTIGAKSGQPRQTQIAYFHDDDDVIVIASNFGGTRHPGWYHNLVAHPACTLGGDTFVAREVTDEAEYAHLYGTAERYYGGFTDYRLKTDLVGRTIPVLRLSPDPPHH